jgi:hypothetical protein
MIDRDISGSPLLLRRTQQMPRLKIAGQPDLVADTADVTPDPL